MWPLVPPTASATPNSLGLWESGIPKLDDSWSTRPASTFYSSAQGLPISFGACLKLFPPPPAINRSGPCRMNVTSRSSNRSSGGSGSKASGSHPPAYVVGGRNRFFWLRTRDIPALRRRGRWSNERTLERYLQEGAYFLCTTFVPTDTDARLDSFVELAPILLASAPLPTPTPTPTFLQRG